VVAYGNVICANGTEVNPFNPFMVGWGVELDGNDNTVQDNWIGVTNGMNQNVILPNTGGWLVDNTGTNIVLDNIHHN
jgi:hypothetical protein